MQQSAVHAGTRLGNYQIDRLVGRGGMGAVHLAYDTMLHRRAALKILDSTDITGAREQLLRDARSAAALNHPNICTVHEVGTQDDLAFIAMEFVEGRPLSEIRAVAPLPLEDVLEIGTQVAGALAHAHRQGVVHRDFKAANVIVMPVRKRDWRGRSAVRVGRPAGCTDHRTDEAARDPQGHLPSIAADLRRRLSVAGADR